MNEAILTQYYLPARGADVYSYKVQVGERLFCFHNLDKLTEDEKPLLIFCSGGCTNPMKLFQTTALGRRDNLNVKQSDQSQAYVGLAEGDYIISSAWDYHSKTGTESLIVNIMRVENYLSNAEVTVYLMDRYYYESSMPFRSRYADQWLSNIETRELTPFTKENIGGLIARGKRMEEIRRSKKQKH